MVLSRPLLRSLVVALLLAGSLAGLRAEEGRARLAGVTIIDEQTIQVHVEEGIVTFLDDASGPTAYSGHYHEPRLNSVVRYGTVAVNHATTVGTWSVSGGAMGAGVHPSQVHRKTKFNGMAEFAWNTTTNDFNYDHTLEHFFYLRLPQAMVQGQAYTLSIGGAANIDTAQVNFTYDIFNQRSEAIKLNLVGFLPGDSVKAVDLYMWLGDGGARDYSSFVGRPVHIRNLDSGVTQQVATVSLWRSSGSETFSGYNYTRSDIWRADFTGFTAPGRYRIAIEGVGASQDFEIRSDIYREPFQVNTLGFFYMRVSQDNMDMTPVPRRPLLIPGQDGHMVYETTLHPWHPDWDKRGGDPWDDPVHFAAYSTGVQHLGAWGGHSDAQDWDRHLAHVSIIYDKLLPYIMSNGALDDDDLGIAESGNGIPDVIDEAQFEVDFFLRLRTSTGGYSHGLSCPTNDKLRAYLAAPTAMAAWANAANAAMLAEAYRIAQRSDLMAHYRDAAITAYTHASGLADQQLDVSQQIGEGRMRGRDFKQMAAAFLYNVTGGTQWEAVINAESVVRDNTTNRLIIEHQNAVGRNQLYATAAYLLTHRPVNFPQLQANMRTAIINQAIAEEAGLRHNRPSRRSIDNHSGYFQTVQNVPRTILAHAVTTDAAQRADFLDALILEADWGLGRNPLNMIQMTTATTSLATRRSVENMYTTGRNDGTPGLHPGHTPYLNMDNWAGGMVMGRPTWMSDKGHPALNQWPKGELYFNTRYVWSHSEHTPQQTMRGKQALYGYLYALGKGGSFPAYRSITLHPLVGAQWQILDPPASLEQSADEESEGQRFGGLHPAAAHSFTVEAEPPDGAF